MFRNVSCLLVIAAFSAPGAAFAFRCAAARQEPFSQVWQSRCIPYARSRGSSVFGGDEGRALVARSFRQWSDNGCTDLSFMDTGLSDQLDDFDSAEPREQRNVIGTIDSDSVLQNRITEGTWSDERLLGVTITSFSIANGEIFDADIVLNAARFRFTSLEQMQICALPSMEMHDIENTLVHEIGHLIGLDHVGDGEATMFASAPACEIKKRSLADDDRNGLCAIYPAGQPTTPCVPPTEEYRDNPHREQCDRFFLCSNTAGTPLYDPNDPDDAAATSACQGLCSSPEPGVLCGTPSSPDPGGCSCKAQSGGNASWLALLVFLLLFRRHEP